MPPSPSIGIFVIGNAPTALFELLRLVREEGVRPDLVIALPVGFVGAAESKERLVLEGGELDIPFITNRGRKGGSNVAAAVVNALADHGGGEGPVKRGRLRHGYTTGACAAAAGKGAALMLREQRLVEQVEIRLPGGEWPVPPARPGVFRESTPPALW